MKKPVRKGIALGLSLALILGVFPKVSKPITVQADEGTGTVEEVPIKSVNMGADVLKKVKYTHFGNYGYQGNEKGAHKRQWDILKVENDRALLWSYVAWNSWTQFSVDNSNQWETSRLRLGLQDAYESTTYVCTEEKDAIMEVTLPAVEEPYTAQWGGFPVANDCVDSETTDRLFVLSAKELETYCGQDRNKAWRIDINWMGDETKRGYWTRSAVAGTSDKVIISDSGRSSNLGTSIRSANAGWDYGAGLVPAFYLDLSKVLLTEYKSNSPENPYNSFGVVSEKEVTSNSKNWHLTLKATEENMRATLAGDKNYFCSGENVTVNHTPANQVYSNAGQTSGLLVDENNEVIAYGKIGNATAGSSTFKIPSSGIADGTYQLYVFAEAQYRYGHADYASDLGTPIPIEIHTHKWDTAWEDDDTHHWHDCIVADCPETDNSRKSGYAAHTWGTPIVTKEATCTEDGTRESNCTVCNHLKTETISAKGHSFGAWQVTAQADCVNDGTKQRVCSTCGYIETEVIPALGHNWNSSPTIDKPATCTEAGSQSVHCSRCATVKEETVIPATGHSYGAWQEIIAPSCNDFGAEKRVCSVCGHTETQNLNPLGHNWESSATVDKAPTCTEAGSQSVHCTRCNAVNDSQVIPALGHDFGAWQETTAATCTTAGSKERSCQRCNHTEHKDIAALGHDWDNPTIDRAATCTDEGSKSTHCKRCSTVKDSTKIPALGHNFGAWQEITAPTCTTVGSQKHTCQRCSIEQTRQIAALGHNFGDWTVTREATCTDEGIKEHTCQNGGCSVSEQEKIPAKGHKWGDWETTKEPTCTESGEETHTCKVCGIDETRELPPEHDWEEDYTIEKEPTCTEAGEKVIHCKNCEEIKDRTEIPAKGHKWGDWETTKEPTCTESGEETHTCKVCGIDETRELPPEHDWEEDYTIEKEPTCTEAGEKVIHCKNCEEEKDRTEIPAKGHKWDDGKITKEPTYTEEGEKTYTCTVCQKERKEPIPKLTMPDAQNINNNGNTNGNGDGTTGNEMQNEANKGKKTRIKTGDDTGVMIWVYIMVIAAAVMAGVLKKVTDRKEVDKKE